MTRFHSPPVAALLLGAALLLVSVPVSRAASPDDLPPPEGPVPLAELGPAPDLSAPAPADPSSAAPQAVDTLNATQDTFISSAQPNSNFGSAGRLFVGWRDPYGATRSAVQFNLNQIARNRAVTRSRLQLFLSEAGPPGDVREIPIYRITSSWSESSATWNTCNDCVD